MVALRGIVRAVWVFIGRKVHVWGAGECFCAAMFCEVATDRYGLYSPFDLCLAWLCAEHSDVHTLALAKTAPS